MTPRLHPWFERALIGIFLAAIVLPGLGMLVGLSETSSTENRPLAPRPVFSWTWEAVRAYPGSMAGYFKDHFAFRQRLTRWQAQFRLFELHASPSPDVIRGGDEWLFYAADGALEDYTAETPLSPEELETWRETLQNTQDWLARRRVAYVFVIVPDKHAIYPEYMPPSVRQGSPSRVDQLASYLARHSTVRVLDLRAHLVAAKSAGRLYHRTDTHWNDRGAYVGYRALLSALRPSLPDLEPRPREAFRLRTVTTPGRDLAGMLGLSEVLSEEDVTMTPRSGPVSRVVEPTRPEPHGFEPRLVTERRDGHGPRAVVFRDSFGSALIPFLSEHFSRAVYLWQYNVEPGVIVEEQPDVVIQEWVARRLSTHLPYDPFGRGRGAEGTPPINSTAPGGATAHGGSPGPAAPAPPTPRHQPSS